jgi:S-adenosylmethionine synthetase
MGHPDKVSDQISDAILDAILAEQAEGSPQNLAATRVAVETLCTTGRSSSPARCGPTRTSTPPRSRATRSRRSATPTPGLCFDYNCGVLSAIHAQSADIARGVDKAADAEKETGAGDQG